MFKKLKEKIKAELMEELKPEILECVKDAVLYCAGGKPEKYFVSDKTFWNAFVEPENVFKNIIHLELAKIAGGECWKHALELIDGHYEKFQSEKIIDDLVERINRKQVK